MKTRVLNILIEVLIFSIGLIAAVYLGTGEVVIRYVAYLVFSAVMFIYGKYLFKAEALYLKEMCVILTIGYAIFYLHWRSPHIARMWDVSTYIAFWLAVANLCFVFKSLLPNTILGRVVISALTVVQIVPVFVIFGYYYSSGNWLNVDAVVSILQTNTEEAFNYIEDSIGFTRVAFFMVPVVLIAWFTSDGISYRPELSIGTIVALIFFIVLNGVLLYRTRENMVTTYWYEAKSFMQDYKVFQAAQAQRKQDQSAIDLLQDGNKGIYVLVIGESETRSHMSISDYKRKTTPWLDDMVANKKLIYYPHAYANYVTTVKALAYALTEKNQYNDIDVNKAISLLEVANKAGYHTVWISNQVRFGMYDTTTTVIADAAEQQKWISNHGSGGIWAETGYFDNKVLDALDEIQLYDKMLIIVHLMGSHNSYYKRYPKEFNVFHGETGQIDTYDNSILYNDYVMGEIWKKCNTLPGFMGMVCFSDHGEGISTGQRHDAESFTWEMAEIPMYIGVSDEYRKNNKEIYDMLNARENTYFTNDLIYNLMLGMMNVKTVKGYEATNDFTGNQYDGNKERFKVMYGEKALK